MGSKEYFIGAGVCFIFAIWLGFSASSVKLRKKMRWGEDGEGSQISGFGALAWSVNSFAWGVGLLGAGLHWQFIEDNTGPLLLIGFILIVLAACFDSLFGK